MRICDSDEKCWKLGQIDIFHAMRCWFGFVPHPAQAKIIRGLKKHTVIVAGRRFGKSKLMAALALYKALTDKKSVQYIVSHSQDQAEIIFNDLRTMAFESEMVRPLIEKTKDFPFPEIGFKSRSVIYARSTGNNDGKYLRGHFAHRVIIDEAAYLKESVISTVILPMLADYDGDIIEVSTPLGRNHFYESFTKSLSNEDYASFQFDSYQNPHISHSFIDKQRGMMTDLQFRTEWLAEFVDEAVCVFPWQCINDAVIPFEEAFVSEPERQYYIGVDVAQKYDYTAIVVLDGTNPKNVKVVYTERFQGKEYSFILQRILSIAAQFSPLKIVIDETGVGAGITEQLMANLPIAEGFTFSMPSKISLINTLKVGLEQRRIKFSETNTTLANELRYYEYKIENDGSGNIKIGNTKMGAHVGKHDDTVIALALAYQKCAVVYGDAGVVEIPLEQKKDLKVEDKSIILVYKRRIS